MNYYRSKLGFTLFILLVGICCEINGQTITRGPYLQMGRPDAMIIKWRTSTPTQSIIEYGTDYFDLFQNSSDATLKTAHEIEITGLTPDTKYFYQIRNSAGLILPKNLSLYFQTSPGVESKTKTIAWILGDPGTGNSNARAVRDAYYSYINNEHTDMILFLGDNAYNDGTDAQYQTAVFEGMYEDKLKNSVSWSTLGNHDGHSADSEAQTGPYYEIFSLPTAGECGGIASGTEAYYSFNHANIHFIVLDSYDTPRDVGGAMYDWCQMDLQNVTADWLVAFWHHPAYTKGSHNSDTEGALIDMRTNFLPLLESYGVDLVLSGHSHSYERSYFINGHYGLSDSFDSTTHTIGPNGYGDGRIEGEGAYQKEICQEVGAVYITAGSSGKISGNGSLAHEAMLLSVKELGSCVLEIEDLNLHLKFLRENGTVRDSFTIQKSDCTTTQKTKCAFINSSYADVEEQTDGSIYQQSSDLEIIRDGSESQEVGLVFQGLNIPQGSWIQSAHIQFMADDDPGDISSDSSALLISGHDDDNTPIFSETINDVSSRNLTIQNVSWPPSPWIVPSERSNNQRTPDLAGVIQEIVNRVGFSNLSNLGFTISGLGKRSAASYDNGLITLPPELCITYDVCVESLQTHLVIPETALYAAKASVLSDQYFSSGNPFQFTAGQEILLQANFEIVFGRAFTAFIMGCNKSN